MSDCEFTPATLEILRGAGWGPTRAVVPTPYIAKIWDAGTPPDAVQKFLRQFGGLKLRFPNTRNHSVMSEFHFDHEIASRHTSPSQLLEWSGQLDESVWPVGEAHYGHMIVLMGASGCVFAGMDEVLVELGVDACAAVETICSGGPVRTISN